jgi:hypothetical protein
MFSFFVNISSVLLFTAHTLYKITLSGILGPHLGYGSSDVMVKRTP